MSGEALEPILRFEIGPGFSLSRTRLRFVIIDPARQRRQRHEDRFGPPARLQSEDRSAVIDQIEFDVTPASDQLKFALALTVGAPAPAFDYRQIGDRKSTRLNSSHL